MGAPIFKVNVKANIENMSGKGKFRKPGVDKTMIFRLAPAVTEDGVIFYRAFNHWKLQDQDGNNIALADLGIHGNDETGRQDYVMEFAKALMGTSSKMLKEIGDKVKGNNIYHAQGFEVTKQEDGTFKYDQELSFLSIPVTPSNMIIDIIKRQQFMNEPDLTDADAGQPVLISRTGKGFDTRYSADRSSQVTPLEEMVPGYRDKLVVDVYDALGLKVYTRDVQKQIVRMSYPELDWDMLEGEMGL